MVNNVGADFHFSNKRTSKAGMRFSLLERSIILVTFQKQKEKEESIPGVGN